MSADKVFVVTYAGHVGGRASVLAFSPSKANAMRFAEQAAVSTLCHASMRRMTTDEAFYDPSDDTEGTEPSLRAPPIDRPYLMWDDAQPERFETMDGDDRPISEVAAITRYGAGGVEVGRFSVSSAELTVFDVLAEETEVDRIYQRIAKVEEDATGSPSSALTVEDAGTTTGGNHVYVPREKGCAEPVPDDPESASERTPAGDCFSSTSSLHADVDLGTDEEDQARFGRRDAFTFDDVARMKPSGSKEEQEHAAHAARHVR